MSGTRTRTHTHTYVILELSKSSFDEIKEKLLAAGYEDQFFVEQGVEHINMIGIAVSPVAAPPVVDCEVCGTPWSEHDAGDAMNGCTRIVSDEKIREFMENHHGKLPPAFREPDPPSLGCTLPPDGWYCSREPGHDGPCAAKPNPSP